MADHNTPTVTTPYSTLIDALNAKIVDVARGMDPATTSFTNQPTNTVSWSSAANKWQKWNGTSWVDLTATYAISISGLAATATALATGRLINGVSFNGTGNITITANSPAAITLSNAGDGAASGSTFNGSAARIISYNSVGAPSTAGAGATGSWGINISGSAGSAAVADALAATGTIPTGATAVTQAAKEASTKVATTAFVDRLRSLLGSTTTGTAVLSDRGAKINLTAGLTIPNGVFADNDVITLYNNTAGNLTITQGSGLTLRLGGTALTGNRTLAQRSLMTIVFVGASEAVIPNGGIT